MIEARTVEKRNGSSESKRKLNSGVVEINGYSAPSTLDFFLGREGGYSADMFSGLSYQQYKGEIRNSIIRLTVNSGLFARAIAEQMVERGMDLSLPQNKKMKHQSAIFFYPREPGQEDDQEVIDFNKYVGFSWQEVRDIRTNDGDKPVFYLRQRAIEAAHTRKHLGRAGLKIARATYLNAFRDLQYFAHRTASPAAADSVIEARVCRPGELSPWYALYDDSTNDPTLVRQQLLIGLHFQVRNSGTEIDMSTGVSQGDYPQPNMAYVPDLTHTPTMDLRRRMLEEFHMDFARGDSLIVIGRW